MVRSIAEKPTSSGGEASSTTCRSSRTDPGFQPNSVRIARTSQLSAAGRSTSPSCTTRRQVGRVARIVVGRVGVRHVSPPAPGPHGDPIRIRIGNAELREDLLLEAFHRFGFVVVFVIVADQMQETVHREMAEMMVERLLFLVGLPARRLIGDRDIAEHARRIVGPCRPGRLQRGKRQHVGRLVDAAPVAVQRADAGIVGQHDRKFGVADIGVGHFGRGLDRAMDHGLGAGLGLPAIGDDENLGDGKGRRRFRSRILLSGISVAAGTCLRQVRGRRSGFQDLPVAGFCGNPS